LGDNCGDKPNRKVGRQTSNVAWEPLDEQTQDIASQSAIRRSGNREFPQHTASGIFIARFWPGRGNDKSTALPSQLKILLQIVLGIFSRSRD
jgi:hypothetical protein